MKAVFTKTAADIGRRKLQSLIIALVILLSSGAATLALSLLVESDAPYDHAFAAANGAHLTLTFAADQVSAARLRATASAHGVTAAAGPWPEVSARFSTDGATPTGQGGKGGAGPGDLGMFTIVGRDRPDAPVDRLTIESGRWARAPGEIVLSRRMADTTGLGVGARVQAPDGAGHPSLLVVGIAASIGRGVDAWVVPAQVAALAARQAPLRYQMLYRVSPSGTAADLRAATQAITARLPAGAVEDSSNYLDVKLNADLLSAVMVPFLLAFSVFALVAAALTIANVVTGVVIASYREIGVMKSIGFTPGQVTLVLLGGILVPALAGCLLGIPLGTLGSQPFLQDTAHALNLPAPFTAVAPVMLLVLVVVLSIAVLAALFPAWRAGRLSAVTAITRGTAPTAEHGSAVGRMVARLPLPRPASLGLGDALARPARSATTTGAILIGVATVVFALSLHLSLGQVAAHLIRGGYVQVNVSRAVAGGPGKGPIVQRGPLGGATPPITDQQVVSLLQADPDTAHFVAEAQDQVVAPGIAEPIPFYAYRGDSSWIGYALIAGRWFSRPGEVVAPTKLLRQARLAVGDTVTARLHGNPVRLRIVGEILDQTDGDLLLRGDWATLAAADPRAEPDRYEVGLKPGADANAYARQLMGPAPESLDAWPTEHSDTNISFLLLQGVIAGLALVLTAISVAGVFNTALLTTREKVRDVAILKAVGMAPAQVVAMVVASVAFLGLIAGALGIPAGLELHRQILQTMGQIASGTAMPSRFYDLIDHAALPLLALSGVVIAALGAWIPAQWAASSGVAEVLQTE